MRKIYIIAIIALLASCSSSTDKLNTEKNTIVRTPVVASKLQAKEFNHFFQVSGTAEAIQSAFISPEMNGQIKKIYVEEGERVTKGQLLAKLNTSVMDNGIIELKTSLELAKTVYEKQKKLWEKEIGSEMQYLQAKNSKESLESKLKTLYSQQEMAIVKAPINGIIDEIFLKEGELGMPGKQMMQIINLNEFYINSDVAESYIAKVKKGDEVNLGFVAYPEMKIKAPIYRIGNVINSSNRTFKIQLKIKNQEEKIKPNLIALLTINDFSEKSALVVPSNIIKHDINGPYLYVVENLENKDFARKKYIQTGLSYNQETMITEGVEEGEMIITKGYTQISAGVEVSLINN